MSYLKYNKNIFIRVTTDNVGDTSGSVLRLEADGSIADGT
jgi:hypothetical protein